MFSIKELESDLFFLEEYRESVIRDISPSLNSLKQELERRHKPETKSFLVKMKIFEQMIVMFFSQVLDKKMFKSSPKLKTKLKELSG
jgi:hypothetical protein